MTEFTVEEWESRKLTGTALIEIAWDMILMAIYLAGGMSFLALSVKATPYDVSYWGYVAAGLFFTMQAILNKFMRLTKPRDYYQVVIKRDHETFKAH